MSWSSTESSHPLDELWNVQLIRASWKANPIILYFLNNDHWRPAAMKSLSEDVFSKSKHDDLRLLVLNNGVDMQSIELLAGRGHSRSYIDNMKMKHAKYILDRETPDSTVIEGAGFSAIHLKHEMYQGDMFCAFLSHQLSSMEALPGVYALAVHGTPDGWQMCSDREGTEIWTNESFLMLMSFINKFRPGSIILLIQCYGANFLLQPFRENFPDLIFMMWSHEVFGLGWERLSFVKYFINILRGTLHQADDIISIAKHFENFLVTHAESPITAAQYHVLHAVYYTAMFYAENSDLMSLKPAYCPVILDFETARDQDYVIRMIRDADDFPNDHLKDKVTGGGFFVYGSRKQLDHLHACIRLRSIDQLNRYETEVPTGRVPMDLD